MSDNKYQLSRRRLIGGATALAFYGLLNNCSKQSLAVLPNAKGYGSLVADPDNILDLPKGFNYQVVSNLGDIMNDGYPVPDRADGMGCFDLGNHKVALVRNHEIDIRNHVPEITEKFKPLSELAFDHFDDGLPHPGGTTTIIYDTLKKERIKEYCSLIGTIRNCAGGVTPWGTWLTCEETMRRVGNNSGHDHGWVFEVDPNSDGPQKPIPLKAMGRFNHEAAAVDPKTGIVYMTEDRSNSLLYRFIPYEYGKLEKGGRLQALGLIGHDKSVDSRNWNNASFDVGSWKAARWIDLDDTDSPKDDLRVQGRQKGAVVFARGEGIHWGDNELYFTCTSGGAKQLGQVMRYQPSVNEGASDEDAGKLQLFFESDDPDNFNLGDNLTVAPNGHLIVCEDQYTDVVKNCIRGITPDGRPYEFAKVNLQTETAGACFSPDGKTLFVNVYQPTMTLAITGPWDQFLI